MAIPVGRTLFKKKEGILTLTSDHQLVTWTPNSGGPPTVTLSINNITSKEKLSKYAFTADTFQIFSKLRTPRQR